MVYGAPTQQTHGLFRDLASLATKLLLQSAMGAQNATKAGAFRVFRTQLRGAFAAYWAPSVSVDVLLTYGTRRFGWVLTQHEPRRVGQSNYTFVKLVRHTLNLFTGFSILPLRFASIVGFAMTLFGIGVLVWVVGRYLLDGTSVAGFPFLASIIALFSGAQMFALGIMGEYVARMYYGSMAHPAYAIRTMCGGAAPAVPTPGDDRQGGNPCR